MSSEREPRPGWLNAHPRLLAFTVVVLIAGIGLLVSRDLEPGDPVGPPAVASAGPADPQPLSLGGCGGAPAVQTQDYFATLQNYGSKAVSLLSVSAAYRGVRLTGVWQVSDCGPDSAHPISGAAVPSEARVFIWLRFSVTACSQAKSVASFPVIIRYGTTHGDQVQRLSLTTYPLECAT